MPSFQENSEFCDNIDEPKIWKIVPGFLRKKSRNVKQKPPETQEVTKEDTNKAAFEHSETVISENDEESVIIADPDYKRTQTEDVGDHQPHQSPAAGAAKSLGSRLSWTYGYKSSDRNSSMQRKKGVGQVGAEQSLEFSILKLDEEDHPSSIRPLQRGESFPGKLAAGTLSKHEAKRRLMSWRRTTIVRKNSEHQ